MSDQRALAIQEARTWINTPWHGNAQCKGAGVDCTRFIGACYRAAQLNIPSEFDHLSMQTGMNTDREVLLEILMRFTHEVETPQPADIAVFRMGRIFWHSALVIEWPNVIHVRGIGINPKVETCRSDEWPLRRHAVKFFSPWREFVE